MEKKTTCSGTFEKIRTLNITITAYISQVLMSQSYYRLAITHVDFLSALNVLFLKYQYIHTMHEMHLDQGNFWHS